MARARSIEIVRFCSFYRIVIMLGDACNACLVMPVMKAYRIDFHVMYPVEDTFYIRCFHRNPLLVLFCGTLYINDAMT